MTDLQASIGREQLRKLPDFLRRREEIFQSYRSVLNMLDILKKDKLKLEPIRYRAVLRTNNPRQIIDRLASSKIKAIIPIEEWELLGDSSLFPNAHHFTQTTVSLPIYPTLTDKNVDFVIKKTWTSLLNR